MAFHRSDASAKLEKEQEGVEMDDEEAAQVLRAKGASNAKTIHSLIYRPRGEEAISDETTGKTSIIVGLPGAFTPT